MLITKSNAWPLFKVDPVLGETKPVGPENERTLPIATLVTQQLHLEQAAVGEHAGVAPPSPFGEVVFLSSLTDSGPVHFVRLRALAT